MFRGLKSEDFHELYYGPTHSKSHHSSFLTFSEILLVGPGGKVLGPAYSAAVSPSRSILDTHHFPRVFIEDRSLLPIVGFLSELPLLILSVSHAFS